MLKLAQYVLVFTIITLYANELFANDKREKDMLDEIGSEQSEKFQNSNSNLKFNARLQLDHGRYQTKTSNGPLEVKSEAFVRRARLESEYRLKNGSKFELSGDFAEGRGELKNMYLNVNFGRFDLRLGQFITPHGNEGVGSSKYSVFMEKSAINSLLAGGRDIGLIFSNKKHAAQRWTFIYGFVSGSGVEEASTDTIQDYLLRFVYQNPKIMGGHLSIGASYTAGDQRAHEGDKISLKSESKSDLNLFSIKLGDGAEYSRRKEGVDIISRWSKFLFRLEYLKANYQFPEHHAIQGGNLVLSYFLKGKQHKIKYGLIGKNEFRKSRWGDIEIGLRYSTFHVDDKFYLPHVSYETADPQEDTRHADAYGMGINWYLRKNIKFSLNYLSIRANNYSLQDTRQIKKDDTVLARFQYLF